MAIGPPNVAGVALVIIDTFQGARAHGATRWLSPQKALIQLSLRYHWEDVFWFSFFHEVGHLDLPLLCRPYDSIDLL